MVDFKNKLVGKKPEKLKDPVSLYETLDRAHDKGPLRPAQVAVLSDWFKNHQNTRDIIVKLHTGQGKTLIGLLMLQSRLNAGKAPVVYLCPDNFLIEQTCEQAKQFGIKTCSADGELPDDFLNGKSILVTSVQKLFNGKTKFGLHRESLDVDTVLMDDAHACADRIRGQCQIRIPKDEPAYHSIMALFANDLEQQGVGTFAEIGNGKQDAFIPVPYWSWTDKESEVAKVLSSNSERTSIKFAWPLLKNILPFCRCVISGSALEIEPYAAPLEAFGSYFKAAHRIFMSATVTDDAFLVRGLQLTPNTILNPLTYSKETWSGEKMILLPSLMDDSLDRQTVVKLFGEPNSKRRYGIVTLVPSFPRSKDWNAFGSITADTNSLAAEISKLKAGKFESTLVLANRYDGIDLPDDTCRVLIFDSKPHSESLTDLYEELCRPNSEATLMRTLRSVEQGMGRSVRGEKDYSVIVAIGTDLLRLLRQKSSSKFLSSQMATQIEIGMELTDLAIQDIQNGIHPIKVFQSLLNQCNDRDPDWKAFYSEQMEKVVPGGSNEAALLIYATELDAEKFARDGDYATAVKILQKMLDDRDFGVDDKGWYLQEIARYSYKADRLESQRIQVAAHKCNRMLLKPPAGVTVAQLTLVSQGRAERIKDWLSSFSTYSEMDIRVSDILGRIVFGMKADKFENALDELSFALGFVGERPDKEWKEGPDNLWALDDTQYILFECKSEVSIARTEVDKRECEQMNRSSAWFEKHYPGMRVKRLIVHPGASIQSAAALTHDVEVVRESDLRRLIQAARDFFKSFESQNFSDLSPAHIQKLIDAHKLSVSDLWRLYSRRLRDIK